MKTYWTIKVEWKEGGGDWAWYTDVARLGNLIVGAYRQDIMSDVKDWRRARCDVKSVRPVKVTIVEVK